MKKIKTIDFKKKYKKEISEIQKAAGKEDLVIFIGSGVSMLKGAPSWGDLSKKFLRHLLNQNSVNFSEYEHLSREKDPRKLLSICKIIQDSAKSRNKIKFDFKEQFNIQPSNIEGIYRDCHDVYKLLYKINAIYITTNFDNFLDQEFKRLNPQEQNSEDTSSPNNCPKIYLDYRELDDINKVQLKNGDIYHIHGSIDSLNELTLSTSDYLQTYKKDNKLAEFLDNKVFKKTVLFIGYGLNEDYILEHIIQKDESIEPHNLFILYPFRHPFEKKFEEEYFKTLGIHLIDFNISKYGYKQLYYEIRELSKLIQTKRKNQLDNYRIVDRLFIKNLSSSIKEAIALVLNDDAMATYYFQRAKDDKYFKIWDKNNLFSKLNNPLPIKTSNGYIIPEWNVLPYLEMISSIYRKYNAKLIKLIRETTFHKVNGHYIDNYRTWWYFIKILQNIPLKSIPLELVEHAIPIWINSKFNTTLQSSDLATKLLPKFLAESKSKEDFEKTEILIKTLLTIKFEPEDNVFGKREEGKTLIESHWLEDGFLDQKLAKTIGEKCSLKPILYVMDNLKEMFRKKSPERNYSLISTREKLNIVSTNTNKGLYEFQVNILDKTKDKTDAYVIRGKEPIKETILEFSIKANNRQEYIDLYIRNIKKVDSQFKELNDSKVPERLFESYAEDYSYIWAKNIAKTNHSNIYNADDLFVQILREMSLAKVQTNIDEGKELITRLLSEEYPQFIFKRIALFLIAECWNKYKQLFNNLLTNEKLSLKYFFIYHQVENELRYLLSNNSQKLDAKIHTNIQNILESVKSQAPEHVPEDKKEQYIDEKKLDWYEILKGDAEFNKKYIEYTKKVTSQRASQKPIDPGWTDSVASRASKTELLSWSNRKVSEYINKQKRFDFRDPEEESLNNTLKNAVLDNPDKFSKDLKPFLVINERSFYTISYMFQGFKEAWTAQKQINWENIMDGILQLLENQEFWSTGHVDTKEKFTQGFSWCLSAIVELLQEGCKTDAWAFDEKLHTNVEKIIDLIISNYEDAQPFESGDQLNHSLNTVLGKTISLLIYLGLREARLSDKKKEGKKSKWNKSLKENFKYALEKKKIPDAYAQFGHFLANLHYIDKEWTESTIKDAESTDEPLFISFLDGYLYIGQVYKNLYTLLVPSYERGLKISFDINVNGMSKERLIEHIAIGYLRDYEKIEGKLVNKQYIFNNPQRIEAMIDFFWQQRDFINNTSKDDTKKIREKFKAKIMTFWEYVYDLYKDNQKPSLEQQKVLSELTKFTIYLSAIEKAEFNLLEISAPYVTVGFDSYAFIESLNTIKDNGKDKTQNAIHIAKLYILMLEGAKKIKNDFPDFDSSHIKETVTYLYELSKNSKELNELTNKICILYAEGGNLMLRGLYEQYNK